MKAVISDYISKGLVSENFDSVDAVCSYPRSREAASQAGSRG